MPIKKFNFIREEMQIAFVRYFPSRCDLLFSSDQLVAAISLINCFRPSQYTPHIHEFSLSQLR